MSFQLSLKLNKSKTFLVNSCDLAGRFDPHFHKPEFKLVEDKIHNSKWQVSKLKDLFNINRGGSPRPIQDYLTEDDDGVNWIKIGDTKGVDKYIYKTKQKISPSGTKFSRQVIEGDFILSNSMSFGKPFIMRTSGYIHDGWLLFRSVTNEASKDYLHTVLGSTFVYKLFKKQTIGGGVENLNIDLVKHIKIPIPPKEIQESIVSKMELAYSTKKQKEAEAQQLLDSIDDYLLAELGIELPEQAENTVQSRIFTRRLTEVLGSRIDPYPYQDKFKHLEKALNTIPIPVKKLKNIVSFFDYGLMPTQDYAFSEADGLPMIRVTNIKSDGSIDMSKTKYIKFDTPRLYKKIVQSNDILMVQCGNTTGKCGLVPQEYSGYTFGSFSFVIRGNSNLVSQKYLFNILSSVVVQEQLNRNMTITSVRPNTSKPEVLDFKIPLPSLEKQTEIANHITDTRNQAKQLQQQAKTELEQAKKQVEAMILGEA